MNKNGSTRQELRPSAVRLHEKATEKQDAQNHDNRNNNDFDETHGEILSVFWARSESVATSRILEAPSF